MCSMLCVTCIMTMTSNFIKSFTISKLFIQSLPLYTSRLFTISSNAHTEDIEKPHRICSPCFFVDNFSGLFLHLLIFLIKYSRLVFA